MRRAELDLEDLHAAEASKEVPLDLAMQDRLKYFEGRAASDQGGSRAAQRSEAVSSVPFTRWVVTSEADASRVLGHRRHSPTVSRQLPRLEATA